MYLLEMWNVIKSSNVVKSVLLLTKIRIITMVKMLWTYEEQLSESIPIMEICTVMTHIVAFETNY